MANESLSYLQGDCIPPFLDAARFPTEGGFVAGRFCAPLPGFPDGPICCLPCPITNWTYPDTLKTYTTVAEWFAVAGLVLLVFMLLTYLMLPAQKTRSHYLSVCLVVSTIMIGIGFTIPLGANPDQCYNEITPNDMYSSQPCAWSGAFIIAGGLSAVVWIFIRALSMNLQICWDIVPGRKFFYVSQAAGWGIPAVLFTVTMTLTGVSFRFGNVCHVNHDNSMADFWGPLLAFAGASGLLQLMTFAHCLRVYLKNLFADQAQSTASVSSGLPSYSNSVKTQTARAVWRRLQKVLWLQWRGICIVTIILVDVIFFSIVFVRLDNLQYSIQTNVQRVKPWLFCLAENPTDRNACMSVVDSVVGDESTVVAVLFLLALTGIQVFLFLARPSIFPAWVLYFQNRLGNTSEFVSLDAKAKVMRTQSQQGMVSYTRGHDSTTFEMQTPAIGGSEGVRFEPDSKTMSSSYAEFSSPEKAYYSPGQSDDEQYRNSLIGRGRIARGYTDQISPDLGINGRHSPIVSPISPPTPVVRYEGVSLSYRDSDYFTFPERTTSHTQRASSSHSFSSDRRYQPPMSSFSTPNAPSRQGSLRSVTFDLREQYSRGGLGLNPPSEAAESQEDLSGYRNRF